MVQTVQEIRRKNAQRYVENILALKAKDPKAAKKYASQELIKMGLLSKNGRKKDRIVSWE